MSTPPSITELVTYFEQQIEIFRADSLNETETRIQFINPFFEALGWDINNRNQISPLYQEVIHEAVLSIKNTKKPKAPDYSFNLNNKLQFFVEAKKPSVNIGTNINAAFQLRRYGWSAKLAISILTDFEEFAVYDCRIMPRKNDSANTARIKYFKYTDYQQKWEEIYSLFSKEAVLNGSLDKLIEEQPQSKIGLTVDNAFLREIETWREKLAENLAWKNPQIKARELNFAVQMTINRMIFLRICEDRGIEPYEQLFDLLKNSNIYQELGRLFLNADYRYNSGLFHFKSEKGREKPDDFTLQLKIDDFTLRAIIQNLYPPESPYEFSKIPVEILGQVYEQFLGKVIRLSASRQAIIEDKPEVRKAGGVYYTPSYIVDYIIEHTIGSILKNKTPETAQNITILDPACGSGSFLIVAYQFLLNWYLEKYLQNTRKYKRQIQQIRVGQWTLKSAEKKRILLNHIYGVDIDQQAVETTKLSLLLKVLEGESQESINKQLEFLRERALPDLDYNIQCGNSLIASDYYDNIQLNLVDEDEIYRVNVFDWEDGFTSVIKNGGFDIVIGNPPYIQSRDNVLSESDKNYFYQNFKTTDYQLNTYGLFLEKSIKHLRPDGYMGMIIPNYWLSNKSEKKLRKFLFLENSVIDLINVYRVFTNATVDTLMLIVRRPQKNIFPKQCLIKSVNRSFKTIEERLFSVRDQIWEYQSTLNIENSSADVLVTFANSFELKGNAKWKDYFTFKFGMKPYEQNIGNPPQTKAMMSQKIYHAKSELDNTYLPLLKARNLKRYYLKWEQDWIKYGDNLAAPRKLEIFRGDRIILNRIISGDKMEGMYLKETFVCNTDIITLKPSWSSVTGLNWLFFLGILLSRPFAVYLKSKNINLDRAAFPKINTNTLENIAVPKLDFHNPHDQQKHDFMVELVKQMIELQQQFNQAKIPPAKKILQNRINATDKQINQLVYQLYQLNTQEIAIIEETIQ
ncbi:MAG: Eco57I restriction-modification methylase domain-containing protein [Microcystaceae cyanobacterium]